MHEISFHYVLVTVWYLSQGVWCGATPFVYGTIWRIGDRAAGRCAIGGQDTDRHVDAV